MINQRPKHHFVFRGLLQRLLLCLFAVLVAIVLAELILQVKHRGTTVDRWAIPHKRYGFIHRKSFRQEVRPAAADITWSVSINSQGFRGPEYDLSDTNALRVLLLGDSFTFGYGVNQEETFAGLLEKKLNAAGIRSFVFNAGVTGWGTAQQFLYAQDHFELLKPDIIVVTFCENDPIDDEAFARGVSGGLLPSFPGKRWIRDRSRLYEVLYQSLYAIFYSKTFQKQKSAEKGLIEESAIPLEFGPTERHGGQEWWIRTQDLFRAFHRFYKARNPRGIILVQATEFWRDHVRFCMETIAAEEVVSYIDLREDASELTPEQIKLSYDPHWNQAMHMISAERLFREIAGRVDGGATEKME